MIKNFLSAIAILICISGSVNGQGSMLKLEDVWANRQFFASGLTEVRSMKDGLHYTELTTVGPIQCIVKNELSTGKTVDTLLKASSFKQGTEGIYRWGKIWAGW